VFAAPNDDMRADYFRRALNNPRPRTRASSSHRASTTNAIAQDSCSGIGEMASSQSTAWVVAAVAAAGAALAAADPGSQPFAFLIPDVRIDAADRVRLDAYKPIVKLLPAANRELGVVAAVRLDAPPQRLIAWTRQIEALQQGRYVPVISRFSDPPQLDDLAGLNLDPGDVRDLEKCRPGKCGVKLGGPEIERLRAQVTPAASPQAVQQEFRRIVLERAQRYLADGDVGLPPYYDDDEPVAAETEVATLLARLGLYAPHLPGLADYVQWFPRVTNPHVVDSFLYWATESLGPKPIASVTHVALLRGNGGDASTTLAVSKQVFASHYRDGAMSMTAITGSGRQRYLVYVHRSHLDVFQGPFGGFVRSIIERRIQKEAPAVLTKLRARLEEGDPPQGGVHGHAQ
jgi:hypothetical protein